MTKQRNRAKQTIPFKDRLAAFASDLRQVASLMPSCAVRDEILRRAARADTASHIDDWANSRRLQPPE
jgi:hypothetical protein